MKVAQFFSVAMIAVATGLAGSAGCTPSSSSSRTAPSDTGKRKTTPVPVVRDDSTTLILSWFEDGDPKTATRVADVPPEHRRAVRVQDVSIPPEQRDPAVVYIADLRTKRPDGTYPVRALPRNRWEARRHPDTEARADAGSQAPPVSRAAPDGDKVILYATKHCPVCKRARKWLLQQQIPFEEIDVEADPAAAAALAKKGAEQGVSTNGVPIFDIRGHLVPGFDPDTVLRLWRAPASPPPPPTRPAPGTRAI